MLDPSSALNSFSSMDGMSSASVAAAAAAMAAVGSGPLEAVTSALTAGSSSLPGSPAFKADATLIASAALACFSVGLNLYGSLLTERKRAELQRELERERTVAAAQMELQSLLARYRGPLLESAIDLEQVKKGVGWVGGWVGGRERGAGGVCGGRGGVGEGRTRVRIHALTTVHPRPGGGIPTWGWAAPPKALWSPAPHTHTPSHKSLYFC